MALSAKETADKPRDMIPADEVETIIARRVAAEVERVSAGISEQIAAQIAALAKPPSAPSQGPDQSWMEALALAISNVTDQEIGRRRIPPEEMAKRVRAREAMEKLIDETSKAGVQPVYTIRNMVYFGERKIPPFWVDRNRVAHPTEIGWWSVPNEFMDPVNDEAKAISALFLESIGGHVKRNTSLRVTAQGLTVRSGGMNPEGGRDSAPQVGRDDAQWRQQDVPTLKGRNSDVQVVETRILGTLMPPARQMV